MQLPLQSPPAPDPPRPRAWVCALVILFAVFEGFIQLSDYGGTEHGHGSLSGSYGAALSLAARTNIIDRDTILYPTSGSDRYLDLALPPQSRIYLVGLTGPTNASRSGYYYYMTYYTFPRDVEVTLDMPRFTQNGIEGRTTTSNNELLDHRFDLRIDFGNNDRTIYPTPLHDLIPAEPVNPEWFDSASDFIPAFLLPLLTAVAGLSLLRGLFPGLSQRMFLPEQLAGGLGLGMIAVAAATLGMKLSGFHGRYVVLLLTGAMSIREAWRNRAMCTGKIPALAAQVCRPVTLIFSAAGIAIFALLFWLAQLQGIVEFDAVANWALKAKIFHLFTGRDIVAWFSNPRLAYAHLDYPTLVPSLHAATFDSIGHASDFATKFWPAWMLLFLLLAILSVNRNRVRAALYFVAGLLLLPAILNYVQTEGATMPMIFFTVLGSIYCVLGQKDNDRDRLALGLTFFFGAAMTKFEGSLCLAIAVFWTVLLSPMRPRWKWSRRIVPLAAFWLLSALPFVVLRMQIPALHWQSGWSQGALTHPGTTLLAVPRLLVVILSQLFFDERFAAWTAPDGHLHFNGTWSGVSSLYNHATPGLAWFCLAITIAAWFIIPQRRRMLLWMVAVFFSFVIALSLILGSLAGLNSLDYVLVGLTNDLALGRYLLPMLAAWATVIITLCFEGPGLTAKERLQETIPTPNT